MSFRRFLLALLVALTVLLVLLAVGAVYLLLAYVARDEGVTTVLTWAVGTLIGLAAADLVLIVIALACERVLRHEARGGESEETTDLSYEQWLERSEGSEGLPERGEE